MRYCFLLPLLLLGMGMLLPAFCNPNNHHDVHHGDVSSSRHNYECVDGSFRAKPETHCRMFQHCDHGYWYHEPQVCLTNMLWNNDVSTCVPAPQVDPTTCLPYSGHTIHTSHTSAPCPCFHGHCDTNGNCICKQGYDGSYCELYEVTMTHHYCGTTRCYNGRCMYDDWHRTHQCECFYGYSGYDCIYFGQSSTIPTTSTMLTTHPTTSTKGPSVTFEYAAYTICDFNRCYFGDCDKANTDICNCYPTYIGKSCEQKQVDKIGNNCDDKPCYNGLCFFDYQQQDHFCECYPGYTGLYCNHFNFPQGGSGSGSTTQVPPATTTTFQPKFCASKLCYFGECDTSNIGTCKCHQKYFGDNCHQTQISASNHSCSGLPCVNGMCIYDYKIQIYGCACFPGYTGNHCDATTTASQTPPTTTQPTTTTSTTTSTTTTSTPSTTTTAPTTASTPSLPSHLSTCKKFSTVIDLGNHVVVNNTHLQACPSGSFATPEAFVLGHCSVTSPNTWQQGANVMQSCHQIPLYTPVATFISNHYSSSGSLSGIFLGCVQDGFKLGVQRCDSTPVIDHIVEGGMFTMDPHLYFTV